MSLYVLSHQIARQRAVEAVRQAPAGYEVRIKEPTRSTDANARMWAMLSDVSQQVEWYGKRLTPEDWKAVFTATLKKSQVVPGIDGGFVVLGQSTSRMTKSEFSDLMELIASFGVERSVIFGDTYVDAKCA